jgi:hypothetical protein
MTRAWVFGFGVVLVANTIFMLLLPALSSALALYAAATVVWLSWVFSGFLSATLAPRSKIAIGVSMAVPAAALLVALNELSHRMGRPTDLSGAPGMFFISTIGLLWIAPFCAVGAAAGKWLSTRRQSGRL